ncbi:hypothetical protein F5Y16DRAFT_344836 [Xylariaceae sp. FL0255]|nr:hypothetical protein F5Y16DRAFT_344836 [Xylariaceae sp. FL0255]
MATEDILPTTLSFLTNAAHLLISASPATSAQLMSQRNSLMFNNNIELSDVQRQHVCGSCGHIMVPGQGDVLKLEAARVVKKMKQTGKNAQQNKQKAKAQPKKGCQKTCICSNCGHYTKINLPPPPSAVPMRKRRAKQMLARGSDNAASSTIRSGLPATTVTSEPTKSSANASSKKRAKNRKQGLQALLQQSNKPSQGLGLSLSDFMKS